MTTAIQKWGNSLAVRIPSAVARQIRVKNGDAIELQVIEGALTIRAARPSYQLAKLLKGVKPGTGHGEVDWGKAEGREA
jgi:antitoxin MazE